MSLNLLNLEILEQSSNPLFDTANKRLYNKLVKFNVRQ